MSCYQVKSAHKVVSFNKMRLYIRFILHLQGDWTGCHTGNREMGRVASTGQCSRFCQFFYFLSSHPVSYISVDLVSEAHCTWLSAGKGHFVVGEMDEQRAEREIGREQPIKFQVQWASYDYRICCILDMVKIGISTREWHILTQIMYFVGRPITGRLDKMLHRK